MQDAVQKNGIWRASRFAGAIGHGLGEGCHALKIHFADLAVGDRWGAETQKLKIQALTPILSREPLPAQGELTLATPSRLKDDFPLLWPHFANISELVYYLGRSLPKTLWQAQSAQAVSQQNPSLNQAVGKGRAMRTNGG